MVRIASSFLGAAIAFSYAFAAPAVRRQEITPIVPVAAGGAEGGLNTIDPNVIPSVDVNGSLGNSVEIPSSTQPPVVIETPPPVVESSSTVVIETPPVVHETMVTTVAPMYGSGSIGWQVNYNDCVQQCFAVHSPPPTVVTLPPQHPVSIPSGGEVVPSAGGEVSTGDAAPQAGSTGVVHDILVEPSAGVFRYSPAFVNANVGDVVRFVFSNGQHSVVQSNAVLPCNATVGGFNSGVKSAGSTFEHVVANSDPTFFYSDVEGECAKGLFGGINAATGNEESATTVGALMPTWAANNADIAAALNATSKLAVNTAGLDWGRKIETKDIPAELHPQLAQGILFTRAMIARNPEMVDSTGQFNPQGEVVIPTDMSAILSVANAGGYPAPAASDVVPENVPVAANNLATPSDAPTTDGAGSIVSSRVAYAAVALLGALFMF